MIFKISLLKNIFIFFLFLVCLNSKVFSLPTQYQQARAVWVGRKFLSSLSRQDVKNFIEKLKSANFNLIFVETYAAGETIYKSKYTIQVESFKNKEKDFLNYFIKIAHKNNFEVHSWVWTFCAASGGVDSNLVIKHPQWLAIDRKGNILTEHGSKFLNPAHPQVRKFLKNIFLEIINNFDFDGLQLDYVRYSIPIPYSFSYDKYSRKIFAQESGVDPLNLTPNENSNLWEKWNKWRINNVTSFVADISTSVKKINKNLKISAAVFPEYPNAVMQDWKYWAETGLVDFLCPMSYLSVPIDFEQKVKELSLVLPNFPLYFGVLVEVLNADTLIAEVISLKNLKSYGVSFFSAQSLKDEYLDALKEKIFTAETTLPHKDLIAPPVPIIKSAKSLIDNEVNLKWEVKENALDGDKDFLYNIYRRNEDEEKTESKIILAKYPFDNFTDSSVLPNNKYFYFVTSLDKNFNESLPSNEIEILTKNNDDIPPLPPLNILLQVVNPKTALITWDEPLQAEDGDSPAYYKLCRGIVDIPESEKCFKDKFYLKQAVNTVEESGYQYYYYVISYDKANNKSLPSDKVYFSPLNDNIPPLPPKNLQTINNPITQIILKWNKPESASDGEYPTYYKIYKGTIDTVKEIIIPQETNNLNNKNLNLPPQEVTKKIKSSANLIADKITAENFIDINIEPDKEYFYQVTAVDSSGNESEKTEITFKVANFSFSAVALLRSEYSAKFNPLETNLKVESCAKVLQTKKIAYTVITDYQVEQGVLLNKNYKILFLPANRNMSLKEVEEIKKFVSNGGKIIAVYQPSFKDENDYNPSKQNYLLNDIFNFKWTGYRNIPSADKEFQRCVFIKPVDSENLFNLQFLPFVYTNKNFAMLNETNEKSKVIGVWYDEDGKTLSYDDANNSAIVLNENFIYFSGDLCLPENTDDEGVSSLIAQSFNYFLPGIAQTSSPLPVQNLSAENLNNSQVLLKWNLNQNGGIYTFNIYRSTNAENIFYQKPIAKNIYNNSYLDEMPPGGVTVYYSVITVNEFKNKSVPSNIISVELPGNVAVIKSEYSQANLPKGELISKIKNLENLLQQSKIVYSVISDKDVELNYLIDKKFKLAILPANRNMSPAEVENLKDFVKQGGKIFAVFDASLKDEKNNDWENKNFALADIFKISFSNYDGLNNNSKYIKVDNSLHPIFNNLGLFILLNKDNAYINYVPEEKNILAEWYDNDKLTPSFNGLNGAIVEDTNSIYIGADIFAKENFKDEVYNLAKNVILYLLSK